ncbi:uncharacterized protein LOC106876059 [Octopus bimaculoides]|uniref:uncharacterized protein LOC106876059 n=1 Tax=Octopus bimaculoides TaxID=37653 RepID=UPI00071D72FC|nr:uncharacterized protein LOC106876059 [Octopus bimaculoides]|eukprot:XP_014779949.1 PREDICTED: uncharacterized protein LOC106876059 [Octopus bimaculoides]
MRRDQHSILREEEVLKQRAKLAIFISILVPFLTYDRECWVMTETVRSRIQATKIGSLRGASRVTLLDRVQSSKIRESLQVELLLFRMEGSQLQYYGHATRMSLERISKRVVQAEPMSRRPRGWPETRCMDKVHSLSCSRLRMQPEV